MQPIRCSRLYEPPADCPGLSYVAGQSDTGGVSKTKKNQRECLVLKKPISSADCGSGRGSLYACPADCPHFPFTPENYGRHCELEKELIQKTHARAEKVLVGEPLKRWRAVFYGSVKSALEGIHEHSELVYLYHLNRDAEGFSLCERWLADPRAGLSNDERVLLRAMSGMRPVLLEVQRFLDEQSIEGTNLMTGETVRVVDRSLAANVSRYTTLLAWRYSMPHYERLSGTVQEVTEFGAKSPLEVVRELVRHLGGPSDPAGEQDWIAWNFAKVSEAIMAVSEARWKKSLAHSDYRFIKADYLSADRGRLEELFIEQGRLEEDELEDSDLAQGFDAAFVVLERDREKEQAQLNAPPPEQGETTGLTLGPKMVGRVLFGESRVRIEATGDKHHRAILAYLEGLAGGPLQFTGELTTDYGARLASEAHGFDAALVPDCLLEGCEPTEVSTQSVEGEPGGATPSLEVLFQKHYEGFIDQSIPHLQGLTPRAAAAQADTRPLLVTLMKQHIRGCDKRRHEEGLDLDLNPLLKELGLLELISDPRPLDLKMIPKGVQHTGEKESELDNVLRGVFGEESEEDYELISADELNERLEIMQRKYPTHADAVRGMEKAFPGLLEQTASVMAAFIKPEDWHLFEVVLVRACHICMPRVGPPREVHFAAIIDSLTEGLGYLGQIVDDSDGMAKALHLWVEETLEPVVMGDLLGALIEVIKDADPAKRPTPDVGLVMLAFLEALVDELSYQG